MNRKATVGVIVSHPIQYFSPLFDLLTKRNNIDLSVAYWNDAGIRPYADTGFGLTYKWDIDLVGGHDHQILTYGPRVGMTKYLIGLIRLFRFICTRESLIIHGYSSGPIIVAIFLARITRTPFLFRSDTSFRRQHARFSPKDVWPRLATRWSTGALAVGSMNKAIHEGLGSKRVHFAPFAIDSRRFESVALEVRLVQADVKLQFGLDPDLPVVAFSGKLQPGKRVQDLLDAADLCLESLQLLIIGDGPLRGHLEQQVGEVPAVYTGFLNQSEIPYALACVDVLVLPSENEPWGLAINEAMASGCVPVVSSTVGCGPDLVRNVGEIYDVGDVEALARAIDSALAKSRGVSTGDLIRERLSDYDLDSCASAYERAVQSIFSTP